MPILVLLVALIPRDTIAGQTGRAEPAVPPIPPVAAAPPRLPLEDEMPPVEEYHPRPEGETSVPDDTDREIREKLAEAQEKFRSQPPTSLEEYRNGKGWEEAEFSDVDYPLRPDYEDMVGNPDDPNRDIGEVKGYWVKGLTERVTGEAINPNLAQRASQLYNEGKVLPEDNEKLLKTLQLLKERIDTYYGEGTYDAMISDLNERMKRLIIVRNGHNILDPNTNNEKIIDGRFKPWKINIQDIGTWFRLKFPDINSNRWWGIRNEVVKEVEEIE